MKVKSLVTGLVSLSLVFAMGTVIPENVNVLNSNSTITASADDNTSKVIELLNLVNNYRQENGLKPFKTCDVMNAMASVRASEITEGDYLNRADGSYYSSIFTEYNITTTTFNQNSYWGSSNYNTPKDAFESFKSNERQNSNMLNTYYEYIGIGVYVKDGKTYYYQLFCTSADLDKYPDTLTTETTTTELTTTTPQETTTTTELTTTTPQETTTTELTTTTETPTIGNSTSETLSNEELKLKYNLDVNKDNDINSIDLLILKKYLLGILYS